ncbi:folate-binding protein YgfZ [Neoehrlichia mikurensis]|uniref:Folate-binding protein YgfZ n=1 Tax=Neoehrlichia mikurensis TaxID=89586 RepID=A0A9Q9BZW5_9RICK|nr:folate-binding protein YgfZ [Neoehrlichia mikurensis]QXK92255.1 folate-binding protein YgfZ [Neoehrlichia mikurensis]QXK92709.1 folate-binding protein YgfZ [Neoehrlichia mikurensis]QXK93947.1 folate-binding protein YgfZ [Neoehrlichia mikurensis]UTO55888.1 folate-binding protein YgfZ [Neoehrlichia mikurensis]UTO56804.1 folate-binding protein YgfZ [Neoehrlichia mikurensis]
MRFTTLLNRSIIKISGPDNKQFLNDIATNNIFKVNASNSVYSLLLTPNGRYIYDFFLVQVENDLLLECDSIDKNDLIAQLMLYKLHKRVKIRDCSKEYKVGVIIDRKESYCGKTCVIDELIFISDPRNANIGTRVIMPTLSETLFKNIDLQEYEILKMQYTVPDCNRDMKKRESFPLHFRMDEFNAIDFNKGCYVGQEVVARMYRIGAKKKTYTIISPYNDLPTDVKEIFFQDELIGHLLFSINNMGLCILQVDKVINYQDVMKIGNVEVSIYKM